MENKLLDIIDLFVRLYKIYYFTIFKNIFIKHGKPIYRIENEMYENYNKSLLMSSKIFTFC